MVRLRKKRGKEGESEKSLNVGGAERIENRNNTHA